MDQNALYKVILLGETHVGKSSFFVRYRDGRFVENLSGTLGLDETIKTVAYKDNDRKIEVNVRLATFLSFWQPEVSQMSLCYTIKRKIEEIWPFTCTSKSKTFQLGQLAKLQKPFFTVVTLAGSLSYKQIYRIIIYRGFTWHKIIKNYN